MSKRTTEDAADGAPGEVPVRLEAARVRSERRADLEDLIERLYRRRTLARLSTWDQMRYGPEVADYLRRRSEVYRQLSGPAGTEGPLPFALGFFRVVDAEGGPVLEPVAEALSNPQPELLAHLLSEFLQPGARLAFGEAGRASTWVIEAEGEARRMEPE